MVLVPALVATPAFAADGEEYVFPITSVAFDVDTLSGGEYATGYFNEDQDLTELEVADGGVVCEGWYKNGESDRSRAGPQ